MITASVSFSPMVVALSVAENQVQQRISMKILSDQIKNEAELMSKIVTGVASTSEESDIKKNIYKPIDFRA
ncbi:MAG TPA: hypothetical protein DCQ28_05055 [Bacteroidetes bacterium]|nr:hypothetical protein [Bacteroidota bacterium]